MDLIFYMKSENKITIDKVEYWNITRKDDKIVKISLKQKTEGFRKCKNRYINFLDFEQIECIIEYKTKQ